MPTTERAIPGDAGSRLDGALAAPTASIMPARPEWLPAPLRPDARLGIMDITEWFGETSGGIRTYLLQKAAYVAERPWLRHTMLVPGERDSMAEEQGVRLYRLHGPPIPGQSPYRFMLSSRKVGRIAAHERPHLIEVGSPFIVPWLVRFATRHADVPLVCFYHSNLPRLLAPRGTRERGMRRALHDATWRYVRRLDRLFRLTVVSSEFAAQDLARAGITRIAKVPLGVDLAQFHPLRRAGAAATRRAHGLPDGPLAGFVGRFAGEKSLELLLDAWGDVEARTGARLVLVGAGPMESSLRAHRYAQRVHFVPFQRARGALADLLAALDVYVSPGSIETFGLSSLEALASGTPVLSADQGGVSEQVLASAAGRLFAAGNRASLRDQACGLFGDDLVELGHRGRAYAEAEHAWEHVFDRLFAVYHDVLGIPNR